MSGLKKESISQEKETFKIIQNIINSQYIFIFWQWASIVSVNMLTHRYDNPYKNVVCYPSTPCMHVCMLNRFSHAWLFVILWTVACQVPLSMGFSRQECWSGLSCPLPGDLPDPRIKPESPVAPALKDSLCWATRRSPSLNPIWVSKSLILYPLQYLSPQPRFLLPSLPH